MKKCLWICILTSLFLIVSTISFAQSAKEAVRALQKIQAKVESGIIYRDYLPALGDARFEVTLFLNSSEVKNRPALAEAIAKAMEYYQIAGEMWGSSIKNPVIGVQVAWDKANQELEKAMILISSDK